MPEVARQPLYLLDTHVLYWMQAESQRLTKKARQAIDRGFKDGRVAITIFSVYELAQMLKRGRITSKGRIFESLQALTADIPVLPITTEITSIAVQLPGDVPRDPGDRIIVATAIAENAHLVTADRRILSSKAVKTIW